MRAETVPGTARLMARAVTAVERSDMEAEGKRESSYTQSNRPRPNQLSMNMKEACRHRFRARCIGSDMFDREEPGLIIRQLRSTCQRVPVADASARTLANTKTTRRTNRRMDEVRREFFALLSAGNLRTTRVD